MTQFQNQAVSQTSRFNSVVIGAFTAAMIIVGGLLPFTIFATH